MSNYETRVQNGELFDPVEWQTREVLWASVKAPYTLQWQRWLERASFGSASASFVTSNWGRAEVYINQHEDQPELIDQAALHMGKLTAGLTCSLALLTTRPEKWPQEPEAWAPEQEVAIRAVIAASESSDPLMPGNERDTTDLQEALVECHALARLIGDEIDDRRQQVMQMALGLFNLSAGTMKAWLDFIDKYDGKFVMTPGGTPRSSGDLIHGLQQKYKRIVNLVH